MYAGIQATRVERPTQMASSEFVSKIQGQQPSSSKFQLKILQHTETKNYQNFIQDKMKVEYKRLSKSQIKLHQEGKIIDFGKQDAVSRM